MDMVVDPAPASTSLMSWTGNSSSAGLAGSSKPSTASSSRNIEPSVESPVELETYIAGYKGRNKISRLHHIHANTSNPDLRSKSAALAIPIIKAETFDLAEYRFFGGDTTGNDPWYEETEDKFKSEAERLEVELKTVTANLIKESIRMTNRDLGNLYSKAGDAPAAIRYFNRTREFNTSGPQMLEMSLAIIEIALITKQYTLLSPHITKALSALERPVPGSNMGGSALNSNVPLSAAQQRQKDFEKETQERTKREVSIKLKIAKSVSALGMGDWERCAREALDVGGPLGDWNGTVVVPADMAIYAVLCSLATLSRSFLKTQILENTSFRTYYLDEAEPYVRELVENFVDGKYSAVVTNLAKAKNTHLMDPHLAPHINTLTALIRKKSIIQYFTPYKSVSLSHMSEIFGSTDEVEDLIRTGDIKGRIDSVSQVLTAYKEEPRSQLFHKAIKEADDTVAASKKVLLRMMLIEQDLHVKGGRGHHQGDGGNNEREVRSADDDSSTLVESSSGVVEVN